MTTTKAHKAHTHAQKSARAHHGVYDQSRTSKMWGEDPRRRAMPSPTGVGRVSRPAKKWAMPSPRRAFNRPEKQAETGQKRDKTRQNRCVACFRSPYPGAFRPATCGASQASPTVRLRGHPDFTKGRRDRLRQGRRSDSVFPHGCFPGWFCVRFLDDFAQTSHGKRREFQGLQARGEAGRDVKRGKLDKLDTIKRCGSEQKATLPDQNGAF